VLAAIAATSSLLFMMVLLDNSWTFMSHSTYSGNSLVNTLASACCRLSFPLFLGDVRRFDPESEVFSIRVWKPSELECTANHAKLQRFQREILDSPANQWASAETLIPPSKGNWAFLESGS